MGNYQGAGTSHEVRMELAQRAIAIGYTLDGAGRLMDEAYWVEGAGYGDECVKHPGCRINSHVDGCEACEVVRQSDEAGFISVRSESTGEFHAALSESLAPFTVKMPKAVKVAVVHYAESADVKAPCGAGARMNPNPDKTTCGRCKTNRRYLNALHAHKTAEVQAMFGDAGIRPGMMVRHRDSGVLGIIREITRSGALMGYWGPWRGLKDLTQPDYAYPTPDALLSGGEIITIDDLITVNSQVRYAGKLYTVTKVSMAGGVDLREVGTWRDGTVMSATDFAADLSRGSLEVVSLTVTGAEDDPGVPTSEGVMPEESTGAEAVLAEKDANEAFRNRMVLRAYRTRAKTGMNLTRSFSATIRGFNATYGTACKTWGDVLVEADRISKEWDAAEGR